VTADALARELRSLDADQVTYAAQFIERLLAAAAEAEASDMHLHPTPDGLQIRWRLDGVLQRIGDFPRGKATDVVARLKVLAGLLTYRTDVPQEGRIGAGQLSSLSTEEQDRLKTGPAVEMRVSTFPTLHGERAVVRLFAPHQQFRYPEDLGLPAEIHAALVAQLAETSGALVVTGPAGCGKTTTAYACLRHLVRESGGNNVATGTCDDSPPGLTTSGSLGVSTLGRSLDDLSDCIDDSPRPLRLDVVATVSHDHELRAGGFFDPFRVGYDGG
jgi:general secretion pathway protein E